MSVFAIAYIQFVGFIVIFFLNLQDALTADEKLTPLGRALARLPVDISIGKMLLMGCVFQQIQPVLTMAAALSVQSPFTNRAYRDHECEVSNICPHRFAFFFQTNI